MACARAEGELERVADICKYMPGGAGSVMMQATIRRAAAQAESCQNFEGARSSVKSLSDIAMQSAGPDGSGVDQRSGFERADIGEALLAQGRLSLATATTEADLKAADDLLSLCQKSASNVDDIQHIHNSDVEAMAALLPNALVLGRSHALQVITSRLLGKKELPPSSIPEPPPSSSSSAHDKESKPARPPTLQEGHLQVTLNTCDAADLVITGTINTTNDKTVACTIQATRYFHGRTAITRAFARRNLAAGYLLDAVAAMKGSSSGSTTSEALTEYGSGSVGLSHITAAHGQLTAALEQVNLAVTRFRDMNEQATKETNEDGVKAPSPTSTNPAWRRLGWELRQQRADLTCLVAEVGLLMALWTAWNTVPVGGHAAAGGTAAASEAPLFPLSSDQEELVAPVLRTVSAAAEAALREYEALAAAYASAPAEEAVAMSDHGIDFGCGVARPLALIGVLQVMAAKFVTAEGVFRSVLEKYEGISAKPTAAAVAAASREISASASQPVAGSLAHKASKWQPLPFQYKAHIGSFLHSYSALLKQWDKREREAEEMNGHALTLLRSAGQPLNQVLPAAGSDHRLEFLANRTFGTALTTMHIGSFACIVPADLAEI